MFIYMYIYVYIYMYIYIYIYISSTSRIRSNRKCAMGTAYLVADTPKRRRAMFGLGIDRYRNRYSA